MGALAFYNVYTADAPGSQEEQICYSTAKRITGPWADGGFVTGSAKHGFTIHPSVIHFKDQWYFFYHDVSYSLDGTPGGDCRRSVCAEYLYFNADGSIKPIILTTEVSAFHQKNKALLCFDIKNKVKYRRLFLDVLIIGKLNNTTLCPNS